VKVIAIDHFGAPPSRHDLPVPEPREGEVLVRVRASSVNGVDVAVAAGFRKGMTDRRFPVVLGRDFAGTVEAAGPGVQSLRPGDAVFGVAADTGLGAGAFGEYVTAPEAHTARVPAGLELATAGALGLAGTAALAADHVGSGGLCELRGEHSDACGARDKRTPVRALPTTGILGRLAADVVNGQLTVPVQRTYPLADAPRALADFAAGAPRSWPSAFPSRDRASSGHLPASPERKAGGAPWHDTEQNGP
jgi:NADPH:quinone reductase-like Zn-dependent oxidoreductase